MLLSFPFVFLFLVGILRLALGTGHGLLPLLAMGPAAGAALGGVLYTVMIGVMALTEEVLFAFALQPVTTPQQNQVALLTIGGVTLGGALASYVRGRREKELRDIRAVADVAQRVLLRPIPDRVGSVRLSARYLSASSRAQIGGDLYAAVPAGNGLRLIVGDAEGKGLTAVEQAAAAMDAFRVAAREEGTLSEVVVRIEDALRCELGDEQFITAVFAEVSQDGREMLMVNCGHPQPLRLGVAGPDFLGPSYGSLPLGMGGLAASPRVPFTIPWQAGEPVLFYTDGLTEARDSSGEFFPLTKCTSIQDHPDPNTLVERLSAEVNRYVGHQSPDDIALLLLWRQDEDLSLSAGFEQRDVLSRGA